MDFLAFLGNDKNTLGNITSIIAICSALVSVFVLLYRTLIRIIKFFNKRRLYKMLKPFYTEYEIKRAIDNYIQTNCQNIDPAFEQEPSNTFAFVTKEKLIPFFIKKVFKSKQQEKYYLILADSGMGKTTFLINLFFRYNTKIIKKYKLVLLPLGYHDNEKLEEEIKIVRDKKETILLLDSFDEDGKAVSNYKNRMQEVIRLTHDFQCVLITCRSQFFPVDHEIPKETGIYKLGVDKGLHVLYKIYLSPFDDNDIKTFLRKKYNVFRIKKRRIAKIIVKKSPNLMVRPMLLTFIDDLIENVKSYKFTYEIYDHLISKWIERENVSNKEELRKFSMAIAFHIYQNRYKRQGLFIDSNDFKCFADEYNIKLKELEMKSRSLLNRNADDKYKFAHKSILEYLLTLHLIQDSIFKVNFIFKGMEQVKSFYLEMNRSPIIINESLCYDGNIFQNPFSSENSKEKWDMFFLRIYNSILSVDKRKEIIEIYLDNMELTSFDFPGFLKLKVLNISNNTIRNIDTFANLSDLEYLNLENNRISDLKPLFNLRSLKYLNIRGNPIISSYQIVSLSNLGVKIEY